LRAASLPYVAQGFCGDNGITRPVARLLWR